MTTTTKIYFKSLLRQCNFRTNHWFISFGVVTDAHNLHFWVGKGDGRHLYRTKAQPLTFIYKRAHLHDKLIRAMYFDKQFYLLK